MDEVTVTQDQLEDALRIFIPIHIDYEVHRNLTRNAYTGEDQYPEVAAALYEILRSEE